jgi:CMP-N-acetylneuraminic acid synthetase
MSYVPYIYDADYYLRSSKEDIITKDKKLYKLPDETIIEIRKEKRISAVEILFK